MVLRGLPSLPSLLPLLLDMDESGLDIVDVIVLGSVRPATISLIKKSHTPGQSCSTNSNASFSCSIASDLELT